MGPLNSVFLIVVGAHFIFRENRTLVLDKRCGVLPLWRSRQSFDNWPLSIKTLSE